MGIDRRRTLPRFVAQPFSKWFDKKTSVAGGKKGQVVLYNDTFAEYERPQIAIAATVLLERAGYEVVLVENKVCCGRPMISKGFLEQARENARQNIEALLPYVERDSHHRDEPSCILTLRDDYCDLVPGQQSQRLASVSVYMLEEFLLARPLGQET